MNWDTSHQAAFSQAADRRRHELARLTTEQRKALAKDVDEIRERAAVLVEKARERQAAERDSKIARAMIEIAAEKQQVTYRPWWQTGSHRLTDERLTELAERRVDGDNKQEIADIERNADTEVMQCIDAFLARQPEFQRERESVDLARARWSEMRESTRYDGHHDAPEQDQGRERGRER